MYENLIPLWHLNEQNQIVALNGNGYISECSQQLNYVKGARHYELSNHLGNVLSVVSDRKIEVDESYTFQAGGGYIYQNGAYTADTLGNYFQNNTADGIIDGYVAEVISATDYYAFGAPMPGRSYQASEYRFGFNGKELNNEVSGEGNNYAFEFRIYDTRLGRWFSLDPLSEKYPSHSPYAFCLNSPIFYYDVDGRGVDEGPKRIINNSSQPIRISGDGEIRGDVNKLYRKPTTQYSSVLLNPGDMFVPEIRKKDGEIIKGGKIIRADGKEEFVSLYDVDHIDVENGQNFVVTDGYFTLNEEVKESKNENNYDEFVPKSKVPAENSPNANGPNDYIKTPNKGEIKLSDGGDKVEITDDKNATSHQPTGKIKVNYDGRITVSQ